MITPARRDIMKQFVKGLSTKLQSVPATVRTTCKILKGMTKKSWKGVGLGPYKGDVP